MKKLVFCISCFVINLLTVAAQAPAPAPKTGLLFEISGKDLKKPSYIFGTFHVICEQDMLPLDKLRALVSSEDQMVMEIDMDDPAELQAMLGGAQMSNGKTLSDYLTPEKYQKVDEVVRQYLGVSVDTMKTMKPSLIGIRISTSPKAIGCEKPSGYDLTLLQTALGGRKPIIGLETVAFQSAVLESKPIDKQAEDLYKSVLDPVKHINELKDLMNIYKQQDIEKIAEFSAKQMKDDKEIAAKLIDDRNKSWIPKITAAMAEKSTFIAVGAAHLGGKNGIIELLRAKGFTLRPIRL